MPDMVKVHADMQLLRPKMSHLLTLNGLFDYDFLTYASHSPLQVPGRLMPDLGLVMENESELECENMKTKKMERDRKRDRVLF